MTSTETQTQLAAEAELPAEPGPVDRPDPEDAATDTVIVDRQTGELVPAPAPLGQPGTSMAPYDPHRVSLSDIAGIARTLAGSGYFQDAQHASQAFAKILAGQELGIGPFRSLKEVRIIDGAPSLSAGATAALIKRSEEYDYKVIERSDERCIIDFYEYGQVAGRVTWTIDDAKRAGLIGPKSPAWTRYPRRMLFARAITEGATTYTPDVFGGTIATPEELGEPGPAE